MAWLPEIYTERCRGCGLCLRACQTGALALVDGHPQLLWPQRCDYCGRCELACPEGAIACPFEIVLVTARPAAPAAPA